MSARDRGFTRRLIGVVGVVRDSTVSWFKDEAPSMGAAIAFYTLFAIAPVLLIVVWVAGAFMGPDVVQAHILMHVRDWLGDSGALAVRALLDSARYSARSRYSTAAEIVTLLISASSLFAELQNSLDRIWRTPPRSPAQGLWSLIRGRLLSFGFILGLGFLLFVSLVTATGLAALARWLGGLPGWPDVLFGFDALLGFVLTTVLFAAIYKYIPQQRTGWRDVWLGALVTATLFTVGKLVIVVYLGKVALGSAYGIAGSFLVLLLWVYYSAQIFLFGAEFTCEYAYSLGSMRDEPPRAQPRRH
jgi:membrane protein